MSYVLKKLPVPSKMSYYEIQKLYRPFLVHEKQKINMGIEKKCIKTAILDSQTLVQFLQAEVLKSVPLDLNCAKSENDIDPNLLNYQMELNKLYFEKK